MVKPGYKQTEIGIIPKDWELCVAKDLYLKARIGWQGLKKEEYLDEGDYYLVTGTDFLDNKILWKNCHYVLLERYEQDKNIQLLPGDILITKDGSIGKTAFVDTLDKPATLNSGIFLVRPKNNKINQAYLYFVFKSDYFNQFLKDLTAGSTIAHLYQKDFVAFKYPLPNSKEQELIAKALIDIDGMISSLEKLIAKKKAIKHGAMQELLVGKKRLPGFTEEWQECALGDLCYLITKQTGFDYTNEIKPSLVDINANGTLPFIQNKDFNGKKINLNTDFYVPYGVAVKYPRILLDETCMLISLSGRIGNVGFFEKYNGLAFIGGAVGICRFNDEQNAEWCMLYLQSSAGQKQIFECQKSGAQHNLTVEDVRKLVIKLPSSLEEQTAIASILSDMDNEIKTLEQKLDKIRQIKQGMMQQLLTGKIRLI